MIGLKDTLKLLGAGFKKADIDAMAALDESAAKEELKKLEETPKDPEPKKEEDTPSDPEPDYKKLYEDQKLEIEQLKKDISEIQDKNIHDDMSPASEEAIKKEQDALTDMVRSFM